MHLSNSTNHDSPNSPPPPTQVCLFPARRRQDPTRVRSMTTTMRERDGTPDATDVWRRYRTDGALASECLRTTSERDEATRLREQVRPISRKQSFKCARVDDDARARGRAKVRARRVLVPFASSRVVAWSPARRERWDARDGDETREGFSLNFDGERASFERRAND